MVKIDCSLKKNARNKKCLRKRKSIGEGEFYMIIPKNDNSGKAIRPKKIQSYIKQVNGIFGGSTTIPVTKGCYVENNTFFCEEGVKITANRDFNGKYASDKFKKMSTAQRTRQLNKDYKDLKQIAKKSAKELGQDSIMVSYDKIVDVSFMGDNYKKRLPQKLIGKKKIFNYKEF